MAVVETLVRLFGPWQKLYSDSTVVSTSVTATHVVSLLLAGGLAIAADRTTLRMLRRTDANWPDHLAELHAVHRPVIAMLALLFVSGLLLAAADVETFAFSAVFWIKMGLIALLLLNGSLLQRAEAGWRTSGGDQIVHRARLARGARISIALWMLTTIAGVVLMSA